MLPLHDWTSEVFKVHAGSSFYTFSPGEEQLSMSAVGLFSEEINTTADNSEVTFPEQQIARILAESFRQINAVVSICARFGDDDVTVWTLLESYDREAREKVYEKELEICKILRIYDFDFRATSISLVNPSELVNSGLMEIYRRK